MHTLMLEVAQHDRLATRWVTNLMAHPWPTALLYISTAVSTGYINGIGGQ